MQLLMQALFTLTSRLSERIYCGVGGSGGTLCLCLDTILFNDFFVVFPLTCQ